MRGKIPRPFHGGGTVLALLDWPSFSGTPKLQSFPPVVSARGPGSDFPGSTRFCGCKERSRCFWPDNDRPPGPASSCRQSDLVAATVCLPDKYSDSSPAERGMRLEEYGSAWLLHLASLPAPCSPRNRSLPRPSSR